MNSSLRIDLPRSELPRFWYNIQADLPSPLPPPLHPQTLKPVTPDLLAPLFPEALIEQEVSRERWIKIPEGVLEVYARWRPSPLYRARRFEEHLNTSCRIYYKYEGVSPPGSHKPNTAVAQAYYNKKEGIRRLTTETGAGQWGSSLAYAGALFGIEVLVYMVRISYEQKPYRRLMMESWGAQVIPSPSLTTTAGKEILSQDPQSPGSLGIAISEAIEVAAQDRHTHYSLGSVLNHVLLHQTIIGLEARAQMKLVGEDPEIIIASCGGGSNFSGISFPFLMEKLAGKEMRVIAVEPKSCPTLTQGVYAYDYGDTAGLTPLLKMYTLGHTFIPPSIHAGGLRYHGDAPLVCHLYHLGLIEANAVDQLEVFKAAVEFARCEGIIPAPESAHAIAQVIKEVERADTEGKRPVILFNLSGHGLLDLSAYEAYFSGKLENFAYPRERIAEALTHLPKVDVPKG